MAQTRIYGGGDKAVEETAEATTHKDKTKPEKATLCCFFLLNLPSHNQQP